MKMKIAKFGKVSYEQFEKDAVKKVPSYYKTMDEGIKKVYEKIIMPARSTKHSAGYDIRSPFKFILLPNESVMIPTGLRCEMFEGYVMMIYPRSSFGIKKGGVLLNTTAVIDRDYAYADNEVHIFLAIKNASNETMFIDENEKIVQAVFVKFGIADEEEVTTERTGGIGSTGK